MAADRMNAADYRHAFRQAYELVDAALSALDNEVFNTHVLREQDTRQSLQEVEQYAELRRDIARQQHASTLELKKALVLVDRVYGPEPTETK